MSTPIETNTEELQKVVNRVYSLPNIGGGNNGVYDLVLDMQAPIGTNMWNDFSAKTNDCYSIVYANPNIFEKLINGEPVKARMITKFYYWDDEYIGNCYSTDISHCTTYNEKYLWVTFLLSGRYCIQLLLDLDNMSLRSVNYYTIPESNG